MNYKKMKQGKWVYRRDEFADEVFFIASGRVNFTYGPDNMVIKTMPEGSYFGEIELLADPTRPRDFDAMTETN